jgi:hypothetical protein
VIRRVVATTSLVAVTATGCVLPARSTTAYTGKALATVTMTLSAAQSALFVAEMAERGRVTAAYTSVTLTDAESDASGAQAAFDSIQPPDSRSDAVRDHLDPSLADVVGTIASMRIVARRGELDDLRPYADQARTEIKKLEAFQAAYR